MSLSSLFGRKFKKRRKKQHITVDDLEDPDSEDDDYKCPGVRKNHRGSGGGVRKSKRLASRRSWCSTEEQEDKEVLVSLQEPSQEEEEVCLKAEKEEYAETLPVVGGVEKAEYAETVARDSSATIYRPFMIKKSPRK